MNILRVETVEYGTMAHFAAIGAVWPPPAVSEDTTQLVLNQAEFSAARNGVCSSPSCRKANDDGVIIVCPLVSAQFPGLTAGFWFQHAPGFNSSSTGAIAMPLSVS
ncbi:MAG: hypothetical protein IT364_10700 [Candidatus Hydrogenedentes bacterium]|nr:hypothetical protein [Candidatus Hydrogenedentota bacterium]